MKTCTLDEIRETVSNLAAQYGAERVYLFGSYACGDMTDSSDIDLRIDNRLPTAAAGVVFSHGHHSPL